MKWKTRIGKKETREVEKQTGHSSQRKTVKWKGKWTCEKEKDMEKENGGGNGKGKDTKKWKKH